jgi:hypothetical protein
MVQQNIKIEFGSPHPPVKSYVNLYFTGKIEVSQRKQGFRQEPTEAHGRHCLRKSHHTHREAATALAAHRMHEEVSGAPVRSARVAQDAIELLRANAALLHHQHLRSGARVVLAIYTGSSAIIGCVAPWVPIHHKTCA